jgi:hypothetical protein
MKGFFNQQFISHLKRLNPWWGSTRMDDETLKLRPRAYLMPVRQLLLEPGLRRAVVLFGPRRVGYQPARMSTCSTSTPMCC